MNTLRHCGPIEKSESLSKQPLGNNNRVSLSGGQSALGTARLNLLSSFFSLGMSKAQDIPPGPVFRRGGGTFGGNRHCLLQPLFFTLPKSPALRAGRAGRLLETDKVIAQSKRAKVSREDAQDKRTVGAAHPGK
jgi:hypothetical protein